ncbi:MAG TPA: LacI family DNA-binding transcriptional regulator [Gryllotalpicola sp.]
MQQVADRAGVSISTVSFVVNDTKPVTPETRERVLQAISELGYRRNTMARALASRRSRILALIYPMLDHRNHHAFIEAAATAAKEHGYNLVLWPLHSDDVGTEITSLIQAGFADGVLLMEVQFDDERVTRLQEANAPFALIGRTRELEGIDYVDIDFERSTELAIDELARLGHRDFGLVIEDLSGTPLAGYAPPFRTEETFRTVLAGRGLNGVVFRIPHRAQAISSLADVMLRDAPRTTAIISMHDEASLSLVTTLPHRGIQIPRDVSIIAIATSTAMAELMDPVLSAYDGPGWQLGREAAEALIARLEGRDGPSVQVLIACSPNPGGTVGPAPLRPAGLSVPAPLDTARSQSLA